MTRVSRRKFLQTTAAAAAALATTGATGAAAGAMRSSSALSGPFLRSGRFSKKVVILGMDGMDPVLVRRFVAEGRMPTFKKLMEKYHFGEVQTTNPPHSPVAWASFITGTDPGGHGIFDFVHRDPATFTPYMSTSRWFDAGSQLPLGAWRLPLGGGRVELMRKGVPFWSLLEENDIPALVCQIPANFPIQPTQTKAISGMGTPDLLGTYGTFTYYTDGDYDGDLDFAGGRVIKLRLRDNSVTTKLEGPKNPFRREEEHEQLELRIDRDPSQPLLVLSIGSERYMFKEGEWSDWIPLRFSLVPMLATTPGMVRVYVKQVHPTLKLYVSPINVDPLEPALPIASPADYSRSLATAVGRFHTQGFPADTKSLSSGILTTEEFFVQAKIILEESARLFEYQYDQFHEGVFFFYFSSIDQGSHMLLRMLDPSHALYEPNASPEVKNSIGYLYSRMDDILAKALAKVDSDTTLIALSDHGFSSFTREFNISSWLLQEGYTVLNGQGTQEECDAFSFVDWQRSKVYALGLNGLYINRKGREPFGWVTDEEGERLKKEIAQKLARYADTDGRQVIREVCDSKAIYSQRHTELAPDLVVGYDRGYRISDEAVLGKFPKEIIRDRTDLWSADHCIHPAVVPGMLLTNREVKSPSPGLWDFAPSILSLFDIRKSSEMTGELIF